MLKDAKYVAEHHLVSLNLFWTKIVKFKKKKKEKGGEDILWFCNGFREVQAIRAIENSSCCI